MGAKWCDDLPTIIVNDLGNAKEMDKDWPHLNIPNYQQIEAIVPDDWVELTRQGDRFWVTVDIVNINETSCEFIGKVQGELTFTHPFVVNDCIMFEGKNILDIHSHEWKNEARVSPNI